MASRNQLHGRRVFDRPAYLSGDPRPALRVQFHQPVRFENIRGPWWFSYQLEAPAIVWGKDGRCWAFLHDFDQGSLLVIMSCCRASTFDRRGIAANPFGFYSGAGR